VKKFLALLLCATSVVFAQQLATTTTPTLDPSQVYSTGNIVQMTTTTSGSTWVNGVYQDQLTCWAWGNPGNCGPNPTVRPGNYINYSFGYTDLHQVQAIASVLPNSAMGLRINGYNFGFTAKNGNGWDDGRVDQLGAYVSFYGTDGKVKDYTYYDLNSKFDWTNFNYSKDFVSPYPAKELSTVQYGFLGKDNNFWAGNYGPEIMNVSFSLKYSVDPCATNVLSSPTCPGYLDALTKLAPAPSTTTSDPITTVSTSPTTSTAIVTDPVTSTVSVTSTTTVGQPSVVSLVVSAPSPTSSVSTSTASSSTSSTTSSSQTTKESSGSGGSNVSLALSVISKNSERDAAGSAIAQSAISQAQAAATQAQQEAQSVAASAVANSMTANIVNSTNQMSSGTGIRATSNTNSVSLASVNTPTSMSISFGGPTTSAISNVVQQSFEPVMATSTIQQTTSVTSIASPATIATQTSETYSVSPPNFLTDRTNPLNDIIEAKQIIPQNNTIATMGSSVNRNASNNEVAGGVDINKMALAPTGYGDYLNFVLRDAAFYAPKEVYKNQRNVDNARALRLMTNDSKHKEMVELQYAK